ncbi:MAG: ABC transporter ATP-binding protein [Limnochordia bacterium]|nr:ABC transporter ATP-binding protein [Limnochordia bacterium]MDI9466227.1 ABC transporter ATP-binding protein [Bacillota bacterium]NLO95478.1 ABC transporter ATP-binding protein [Bacillota bacterium]HOB40119.1 ABC transporter ATP-binding protein [Limnochordia bacterium]HOK31560.1 ABC transporter ATP-binding protein [Limnochordia bacterium]
MTAIALSDVVYRYSRGGFTLRCPALELAPGELTLITGPNGSGKTTLSKLMCGILRPQEGQVRIFGHPAEELSLGEIGGRVGYLFQNPSRQLFASTVWQEMLFVPELLGEDLPRACGRAQELLVRFGLGELKERPVQVLSRGEKQRLAICTMLMGGAEFFILDEPTAGLDRTSREQLYRLLDELLAQGKGLAVISHSQELASRWRARRVRLAEGRVVA